MKKVLVSLLTTLSLIIIFGGSTSAGVVYAAMDGEDQTYTSIDDDDDSEEYEGNDGSVVTYDDDEDMSYEGAIDIYTGLPKGSEESVNSSVYTITDNCTYGMESHMFNFAVNGGTFSSSVADKMITTGNVTFAVTGEFNVALYRDGKKLNDIPKTVKDKGSYTVITWDDNNERQLMTFQIVNKETGRLNQYVMPEGFSVKSVYLDGVETQKSYGIVDLSEEGFYEINYSCNATGVDYTLQLNIDHTPPQVTFEGLDKNDKAYGPVTIKGLTKEDTVVALLDDKKTSVKKDNTLTESGSYKVMVYDKAGNTTTREFNIMLYLNIKSVFLIIAFVLIIIGIFVALYITRKNLRVR